MRLLRVLLLVGLPVCVANAQEAVRDVSEIKVLRGQWNFLHASTAFCAERVPAMKDAMRDVLAHGEVEIRKAENTILREAGVDRLSYQKQIDAYSMGWAKQAEALVEALKRQDAQRSCPVLADNWNASDAAVILEDWRNFLNGGSGE
jgi:hypothetical protein